MILTIVNVHNESLIWEFDPERTVLELKQEIHGACGPDYAVEKQLLIYDGILMQDTCSIKFYNVNEEKVIVVTDKAFCNESALTDNLSDKNASDMDTFEEGAAYPANAHLRGTGLPLEMVVESVGEPANSDWQSQTEAINLKDDEYNRIVGCIVEMGYDRERVEEAMTASSNNPERAVEYLVNGFLIIEVAGSGDMKPLPIASDAVETFASSEANGADIFGFLRGHLMFEELQTMLVHHPDLMPTVLKQIQESKPTLYNLISANRDAFQRMFSEPLDGETGNENQEAAAIDAEPPEGAKITEIVATESRVVEDQSIAGGGPSTSRQAMEQETNILEWKELVTICLSREDRNAIDRLRAQGFPEELALHAYFACRKNEYMAANFLNSSCFKD